MRNDGTIVRTLSAPMAGVNAAVRWWDTSEILAHCTKEASSVSQLWTVPLDGAAPTALTALNSGQGDDPGFKGDLGDGVAWDLPGGTFLQSAGACGTMFLSRLTADGHTHAGERARDPRQRASRGRERRQAGTPRQGGLRVAVQTRWSPTTHHQLLNRAARPTRQRWWCHRSDPLFGTELAR